MNFSSRDLVVRPFRGAQTGLPYSVLPFASIFVQKVRFCLLAFSLHSLNLSPAMQALVIPTTRSLSLISLPALPVARERVETSCVLTRISPSFIRIGSFEALNGPTNMFFFGGGQQKPDLDALRILGEWVTEQVLKLPVEKGKPWGSELVLEVARRNAHMVAGWQAYGFMHGVINTDK